MKANVKDDDFKALQSRLEIATAPVSTGEETTEAMRHLIGAHKPDLVWFDPLLSFVGDDISRQDVCSRFLRQLLNPIADETGVVWMIMHHTPKPSADPKSKSNWNRTDMSYSAAGSSELVNWARAVTILRSTKNDGEFDLLLAKRGERAQATAIDGSRTKLLHLRHSEEGILWEQRAAPVSVKPPKKSKEEVAAKRKQAAKKEINDLDGLIAKIVVPMKKTQIVNLAISGDHASYYLANKNWGYLTKLHGGNLSKSEHLASHNQRGVIYFSNPVGSAN